ncbi:MAG TPA: type II secretion system protein N [Methylibium sp.]|uniref:type II secretion system protein N n=1 Tax=Methylibium sp. TaxID=2067992 RepID=UPI002DBEFB07|nr:type II secretion system protein N [Methylibium sp.]HEU4459202.1 type II secretion system protein N [Methylibium sp.]
MARPFQASVWRPSTWRASLLRGRGAPGRATEWGESTFEGLRWQRARAAGRRWAIWGALLGAMVGLIVFAPAAWLASAVERATDGRLLLADARGSLWRGSAVVVLAGGTGSRDARALPGRMDWTLRPAGLGLALHLRHACCLNGRPQVRVRPGLGTLAVSMQGAPGWIGQWPAAWLAGLGTPWNTLELGGALRLTSPGLTLLSAQGRWRIEGSAALEVLNAASRVSTLPRLGSYRLNLGSNPAAPGQALLELTTLEGALKLSGTGALGPGGLRFRGEAQADEADQAALNNLLNIIGRRNGARSVIAIG